MHAMKRFLVLVLTVVSSARIHGDAPAAGATTNAAPAAIKPPPAPFVPGTATTPEGCTRENFYVHSPSMGRDIRACVLLPPEYAAHPEKSYPILYAFHDSAAPFDSFAAMIPLRKELVGKPMILACFDADADSMYLDSPLLVKPDRPYDPPDPVKSLFTTFFLNEFIPAIDKRYRVDAKKRMLTGFSMGGFGAFHYMLAAPGEFIAVSTMSGYCPDWTKPPKHQWMAEILGPYADNRQRYLDLDLRT
jgi:enterochelin esterase-like enzyme